VAVIPAAGVVAGSACGLLVPGAPSAAWPTALAACAIAALIAFRISRVSLLSVAVGLAFFIGGALLSADAWREASRPSLRNFFDDLAILARKEATAGGHRLPVDASVLVLLTGVLRSDARLRPNGVSLTVDVTSARQSNRPDRRIAEINEASRRDREGREGHEGPERPERLERLEREEGNDGEDGREVPLHGGAILTVVGALAAERMDDWRAGRTVRMSAALRRPSRYLNPGGPDEERVLAARGISLVGTVKSGSLVEVVAKGGPAGEAAAATRAFVRRAIGSAVGRWSQQSAAIVTAIVIGDRAGLDDEVERRLQEAGTYHVIAISGGNIAILAGLMLVCFRVAGALGSVAMLTAAAGLVVYALIVGHGGGSSAERATLMAVIHLGGRAVDLRGPPSNALALAAFVLVAAEPMAVVDPAFLLTFGATLGILVLVPVVRTLPVPRLVFPIVLIVTASAAAEAVLLPIGAFLFSRITLAGLFLNPAAIPLMGIAQIAGMAVVPAAALVPAAAPALGWVAHVGAEGLVRSSDLVRWTPALAWRVAPPHWMAVALYYAGLGAYWALRRQNDRVPGAGSVKVRLVVRRIVLAGALGAAFWVAAEPWRVVTSRGDGRLHVTFIDAGQGDATFVRFPRGATLLVDAGGLPGESSFDVGDRVVAPVLRWAGVRRLDIVAFTHGDRDHIGGLQSIVREFRPGDVWEAIPVPPLEERRALQEAATEIGARWVNVQTHDRLSIDGVNVIVRHPPIPSWERQRVRNDDSIVVELVWGAVSVVLTGDVGRDVERTMTPHFAPAALRVVKIPHHGSLTSSSSEFIRILAPRVAVASAGRSNPFGHPARAVLDRYRSAGASVFRTDLDGAVVVETDGRSLEVRSFTGRSARLASVS
jgi:competence protein ComEC